MTCLRLIGSKTVKQEAGPPWAGRSMRTRTNGNSQQNPQHEGKTQSKPWQNSANLDVRRRQSKQGHRTQWVGANESHAECDAAMSEADEE